MTTRTTGFKEMTSLARRDKLATKISNLLVEDGDINNRKWVPGVTLVERRVVAEPRQMLFQYRLNGGKWETSVVLSWDPAA